MFIIFCINFKICFTSILHVCMKQVYSCICFFLFSPRVLIVAFVLYLAPRINDNFALFLSLRVAEVNDNNMKKENCSCVSQNCCRAATVASRIVRVNTCTGVVGSFPHARRARRRLLFRRKETSE